MYTIRINGDNNKRKATYKGDLSISKLNAVTHGNAPNKYSMAEYIYGKGSYAIRHVKK